MPISEPNPNQTIKTPLDLFHFILSSKQTLKMSKKKKKYDLG